MTLLLGKFSCNPRLSGSLCKKKKILVSYKMKLNFATWLCLKGFFIVLGLWPRVEHFLWKGVSRAISPFLQGDQHHHYHHHHPRPKGQGYVTIPTGSSWKSLLQAYGAEDSLSWGPWRFCWSLVVTALGLNRYVHTCVHSSINHSSQKAEAIHVH